MSCQMQSGTRFVTLTCESPYFNERYMRPARAISAMNASSRTVSSANFTFSAALYFARFFAILCFSLLEQVTNHSSTLGPNFGDHSTC